MRHDFEMVKKIHYERQPCPQNEQLDETRRTKNSFKYPLKIDMKQLSSDQQSLDYTIEIKSGHQMFVNPQESSHIGTEQMMHEGSQDFDPEMTGNTGGRSTERQTKKSPNFDRIGTHLINSELVNQSKSTQEETFHKFTKQVATPKQ